MENSLLIGNGLNRCLEGISAWGALLKDTAKLLKVSYEPDNSMPLEFERIINAYLTTERNPEELQYLYDSVRESYKKDLAELRKKKPVKPLSYLESRKTIKALDSIYGIVKAHFAAQIAHLDLPANAIHREIRKLNVQNVLTTNYDFLLEKAYDDNYIYDGRIKGNPKNITVPTGEIGNIPFFHLHGIAALPGSMCLGFDHYMDLASTLSEQLSKKETDKPKWYKISQIIEGTDTLENTWGRKFFTSNIAIVGLSLTECETDLWWLLTQRAYLYYTNQCGIRDLMKNKIVFYDVFDERKKDTDEETAKTVQSNLAKKRLHNLMEHELMTVETYTLGKDCDNYEQAYEKIFDDIRKRFI